MEETGEGRTRVHNVRFYDIAPRAIKSLSHNKTQNKLALERNDGCIEIWDIAYTPTLEKTISSTFCKNKQALQWCGTRLFSVDLDGELVEWNLQTLQQRRKHVVTGSAVSCLCANKANTELAVGTNEGFVNIFDIENDELIYKQLFDKQEDRIECISFDHTDQFVVTGSTNALRIWNVSSGHALHKIKVADSIKQSRTIVWCLQVLSDFTIVSGDSSGQISFWDGHKAALLQTIQALKADVCSIAVDEQEKLLMCAGVEPIIHIFVKTPIKREDMLYTRWIKCLQRDVHKHRVNALICANEHIYSGGVDGYLGVSPLNQAKDNLLKFAPLLQQPILSVAAAKELILLRHATYLEVWQLGSTSGKVEEDPDSTNLPLDREPRKLLQLQSKHNEHINSAAISPDSNWICYSTCTGSRLFSFIANNAVGTTRAQLSRIKVVPEKFQVAATHMQFSTNSQRLIIANTKLKQILVFNVLSNANCSLDLIQSINTEKYFRDALKCFSLSTDDKYLATASADRIIAVWRLDEHKQYKYLLKLPRYTAATTAIALHMKQPRLVAAYSDGKIIEYDLEEMCFTCASHKQFVDTQRDYCINNIIFDSRNANILLLQNEVDLFALEKLDAKAAALKQNDQLKRKKKSTDETLATLQLKSVNSFEHLVSIAWLNRKEMIIVNVHPSTLTEKLPKAFKQKKFGIA